MRNIFKKMFKKEEVSDEMVTMNDGDSYLLTKDHVRLFIKCCDCGLVHKIEIAGNKNDIWLTFWRSDEKELGQYEIMNIVKRKK